MAFYNSNNWNSFKTNFLLLTTVLFSNMERLVCSNTYNSPKISIKDTLKLNSRNNDAISVLIEIGKPNIFNFLGTKYIEGYVDFSSNQVYPQHSFVEAFELNIIGLNSISLGIALNYNLKKNSKARHQFKLKNELMFTSRNFKPSFRQIKFVDNLIVHNPYFPDVNTNDIRLNIQTVHFSPIIEFIKQQKDNMNNAFLIGYGPEIIVQPIYFFDKNLLSSPIIWGSQIYLGFKRKKVSYKLKYELFIPPINTVGKSIFPLLSNEKKIFDIYNYKRFESLNFSIEYFIK